MSLLDAKMAGSLTLAQFDEAVARFPRLSAIGRDAARMVLVFGVDQVRVAEQLKLHRQQVNRWVKDIYQAHLDCPDGWLVDVVVLPPDLMGEVKSMERKARKKVSDGN